MPLNRELVGKVYQSDEPLTLRPEVIAAYAGATNTANPAYLDQGRSGGPIAPPIYGVVASFSPLVKSILDPELGIDMRRMVHSEQQMRFLDLIRAGDQLSSEARVTAFWDHRGGESVDLEVRIIRDHASVYEATISLFVRDDPKATPRKREQRSTPPRSVLPRASAGAERLVEVEVEVAEDQSLRYAEASGDHNPIHKDDEVARSAGFSGRILHGICTMAMAQNAIVDAAADGDPTRLRSLRGRFSRPVLMGDRLTTRGSLVERGDAASVLAYDVVNQDGKPVIKDGVAEIGR